MAPKDAGIAEPALDEWLDVVGSDPMPEVGYALVGDGEI